MSAARVLNPVMRASPSGMSQLSCGRQVFRIKRDLFGAANPMETHKIFTEELEKRQETAIKKWGFDFRNGSPLISNSHYVWERVSFSESGYPPPVYTLTRAAHIRSEPQEDSTADLLMDERADREFYMGNTSASTDTDSCGDDSQDESTSAAVFKMPAVGVCGNMNNNVSSSKSKLLNSLFNRNSSNLPQRKRQPKITEYMKERKRLIQTPKKVSPAKRLRTSSGSNTIQSHSHSPSANSIDAHFFLRRNK